MFNRSVLFALVVFLAVAQPGRPCSICSANFRPQQTLRQSARTAEFVVIGTLNNPRMVGQNGLTDFHIEEVVQPNVALGQQKVLTIQQFVPVDPKNPLRFLLFGKFVNGKIEVVASQPIGGRTAIEYLKASLRIDDRDRIAVLQFCYKYLDAIEADVANDAFFEFARATDLEIAQLAGKLAPEKLRTLLNDPKTPADRLGIFAYLLGACGTKNDADVLAALINKNDERSRLALSGLLGGLIELRPEQGWAAVQAVVRDPKRHYSEKMAAIGTLRFYHASKPQSRPQIVQVFSSVVEQGDMADMVIEDLRRWQWWELTTQVLVQYSKPTHSAPLVRRSIVRYALACPERDAVEFVKWLRQTDPNLVARQEETLKNDILPKTNP
jgi:hypothetical protein